MSAEVLAERPAQPGLDLHEGISTPPFSDPVGEGCGRWPERLRLRSSNGELVRGRCRSTNLCGYCARLAAVENSELLALDALAGDAPQVWAVLTTRTATLDTARFYLSREKLIKALRRRWPRCEYAALVEFTTGYGPRSGGHRRPHWNLLLKGIPAADVDQAQEVIVRVWCSREDAAPAGQYVAPVGDSTALLAYVALHFQKESQRPPEGWRGHRFLKSRGYLSTATPEAREQARRSLRFKRELWRAIRRGESALDAELSAHRALAIADATTWELCAPPLQVLKSIDTEVPPCPAATPTPSLATASSAATTGLDTASACGAPSSCGPGVASRSERADALPDALRPPIAQPASRRPADTGEAQAGRPAPDRSADAGPSRPPSRRRPPPSMPD